jgi:hypothetical protein
MNSLLWSQNSVLVQLRKVVEIKEKVETSVVLEVFPIEDNVTELLHVVI